MSEAPLATLRRIITGDRAGRSTILFDGPPITNSGARDRPGLMDLWRARIDAGDEALDALQTGAVRLAPDAEGVLARWFVVAPLPEMAPPEKLAAAARAQFEALGARDAIVNQDRHPFMHRTDTLDFVVLIEGEASLRLDDAETRLKPGDVVVQRGTAHAWIAHGGPALFLAVMIAQPRAPVAPLESACAHDDA